MADSDDSRAQCSGIDSEVKQPHLNPGPAFFYVTGGILLKIPDH